MEDVARRAGVALGTVSNVINRPARVSEPTRRKVQRAIEELGFVPNRAARALAAGISTTIGFVVTDLSNSFFLDMTRGAEREAAEAGMNVLLANTDMQPAKQGSYLDLFAEERVAGVLLAPLPDSAENVLGSMQPGRHIVMLNDARVDGACTVSVDNELGGYLAARHLIDLGRRRLAFAGDPAIAAPIRDRLAGVERAVRESNGAISLELDATAEVQVEDGREFGQVIAARPAEERPDGIVAAADLLALGIMQALRTESSIRVPDDIAITGYDNNRAAWGSTVPITTLAQPGEEMGATATRLLLEEIRAGEHHEHRHEILEPTLIVRASSLRHDRN
jgi:LacI family transcriptional regulator